MNPKNDPLEWSRELDAEVCRRVFGREVRWVEFLEAYRRLAPRDPDKDVILATAPVEVMPRGQTMYYDGDHHVRLNLVERYSWSWDGMRLVVRRMEDLGFTWSMDPGEVCFEHGQVDDPGYQFGCVVPKHSGQIPAAACRAALMALASNREPTGDTPTEDA